MTRSAPWLVVLAVGVVGGAIWLLARDDADLGSERGLARTVAEEPAPAVLPGVSHMEAAGGAPRPLDVPAGVPERHPGAPAGQPDPGPTRRVAGRVVRLSDGTPVPDVTMRVTSPAGTVTVDGDVLLADVALVADAIKGSAFPVARSTHAPPGGFVLEGVPVAEVELVLELGRGHPGGERVDAWQLPAGSDDITGLDVVFDTGFAIAGRVTDDTGRPLAGAVVEAGDAPVVRTDAEGRYLVRDALPKAGEEAVRVTAAAPWHQRVARELRAPDDHREVPQLALALPGSGVIEGRVTSGDGRGVFDTFVRVAFEMTDRHGGVAPGRLSDETDRHGGYRIDHVPAGRWVVQAGEAAKLVARAEVPAASFEGHFLRDSRLPSEDDSTWITDVVVRTGEVTTLDLILPANASLRGRVTEPSGAPVAGATLAARSVLRWPAPAMNGSSITHSNRIMIVSSGSGDGSGTTELSVPEMEDHTDARGEYELPHLPPGEIVLSVRDVSGVLRPAEITRVLLPGERALLDVVLESGLHVRGVVVDALGRPVEQAGVYVTDPEQSGGGSSQRGTTDAEGRFDVGGLTPGTKRLRIDKDGCVTVWDEVQPGGADGRWTLLPAPVLRGVVLDARTGEPLRDYDVSIATEGMRSSYSGATYEEGRFAYDCEDDGLHTVTIQAAGYREQTRADVAPSTTATTPLVFRLDPEP
jgi:protocatechuate 3,4-dioxygenase beta subunit